MQRTPWAMSEYGLSTGRVGRGERTPWPQSANQPGARVQAGFGLTLTLTRGGGRHLVARCVCALPGAVWLVESEESIARSHRLRACILLALHPTATAAVVLKLRTGEAQTYGLACEEQFRLELAASVSS